MKKTCAEEFLTAAMLLFAFLGCSVPALAQETTYGSSTANEYAVPGEATTGNINPYTAIPLGTGGTGYDMAPYASLYTNTYQGIPGNYNVWNPTTETAAGETILGNTTNATGTQNLGLPQATQGLLAPNSWVGNDVTPLPSEGTGTNYTMYIGVDWSMQSNPVFNGTPLPATSTASLDLLNIIGD
jgi:hypothetical protein